MDRRRSDASSRRSLRSSIISARSTRSPIIRCAAVKRPRAETGEGKTPAIADGQARKLLDAPPEGTLKGKRDRAILAVLFFHGLRREELCKLRVKDVEQRQGVAHLRIHGKGGKIRFVPAHPAGIGADFQLPGHLRASR